MRAPSLWHLAVQHCHIATWNVHMVMKKDWMAVTCANARNHQMVMHVLFVLLFCCFVFISCLLWCLHSQSSLIVLTFLSSVFCFNLNLNFLSFLLKFIFFVQQFCKKALEISHHLLSFVINFSPAFMFELWQTFEQTFRLDFSNNCPLILLKCSQTVVTSTVLTASTLTPME